MVGTELTTLEIRRVSPLTRECAGHTSQGISSLRVAPPVAHLKEPEVFVFVIAAANG